MMTKSKIKTLETRAVDAGSLVTLHMRGPGFDPYLVKKKNGIDV
jgi:hypothetical protein